MTPAKWNYEQSLSKVEQYDAFMLTRFSSFYSIVPRLYTLFNCLFKC